NNRFIDAEVSREAIDSRLSELEQIARTSGYAVGIGQGHPVTLERLQTWLPKLEQRGFALAPISAMVNTQPD
ncbi:MAG: divergent polysaccharide deacetylase family protein, partial [Alphaproteobacteria bacterium]